MRVKSAAQWHRENAKIRLIVVRIWVENSRFIGHFRHLSMISENQDFGHRPIDEALFESIISQRHGTPPTRPPSNSARSTMMQAERPCA